MLDPQAPSPQNFRFNSLSAVVIRLWKSTSFIIVRARVSLMHRHQCRQLFSTPPPVIPTVMPMIKDCPCKDIPERIPPAVLHLERVRGRKRPSDCQSRLNAVSSLRVEMVPERSLLTTSVHVRTVLKKTLVQTLTYTKHISQIAIKIF